MRKIRNSNNGSMTVEATLVFSTVFITVIALIYICMMLYQQSYIQALADRAAQRGADIWNSPAKDMFIAQITEDRMKDNSLYWRISDSAYNVKKNKIEDYVKFQGDGAFLLQDINNKKKGDITVTAKICEDYVIYKKLRVTVSIKYKNPAGSLLTPFGIGKTITMSAKSEAVVNDTTEFIRNTDFAVDTLEEVDRKVLNGEGGNIIDSIRKKFTGIFGKVKDFLD